MTPILAVVACAAIGAAVATSRIRVLQLRLRLLEARERSGIALLAELAACARISPHAVLERLAVAVADLDPAIDAVLAYVPDGEELLCGTSFGPRAGAFRGHRVRRDGASAPARAAAARHRIVATGALIPGDGDALAIPLLDGDRVLAVVYAAGARGSIRRDDAAPLCIARAAPSYALAVERARDVREATFDGLTGLLTPRAFRSRLREVLSASRERAHCSLWFVDTDGFKAVNDSLGHGCGDAVLAQMAALLRDHAGSGALVARNGGDEFCALLPGVPKSAGAERAERFRAAVAAHDFGIARPMSASVGVAGYPLDGTSASTLLERADAAMYAAKRSGRNRVRLADEVPA